MLLVAFVLKVTPFWAQFDNYAPNDVWNDIGFVLTVPA